MPTISIMRLALSFLFASSILLAGVGPGVAYEPENNRADGNILSRASPNPLSCQKACFTNPACKAWTFVKPQEPSTTPLEKPLKKPISNKKPIISKKPMRPSGQCQLKDSIPDATFSDCCISGVKPSQSFANPRYIGMIWESSDSPLTTVTPRYPDPLLCQSACYNNIACNFWSYTSPSSGQPHICKLFSGSGTTQSKADANSISGVKPTLEFDTNRDSGNMAQLPGPQLCQKACNDTPGCMSFTYVTPQQGVDAVCRLKNAVPASSSDGCCISGTQ